MRTSRPWAATLRSVLITALALVPALPEIARAAGIETVPFVASILAISGALTRVLAVPAVATQLERLGRRTPPTDPAPLTPPTYIGQHRSPDEEELS
ncbi:hypothetical protein GCM10009551_097900 [Nocardiopsis tropica]